MIFFLTGFSHSTFDWMLLAELYSSCNQTQNKIKKKPLRLDYTSSNCFLLTSSNVFVLWPREFVVRRQRRYQPVGAVQWKAWEYEQQWVCVWQTIRHPTVGWVIHSTHARTTRALRRRLFQLASQTTNYDIQEWRHDEDRPQCADAAPLDLQTSDPSYPNWRPCATTNGKFPVRKKEKRCLLSTK